MDITSASYMSSAMPASQSTQSGQDSHEKNIQNQIVSLQGKMRGIANNNTMSEDEKSDEKKKLQEQIQNLNSELKQYKINKRREGSEKTHDKDVKSDDVSDKGTGRFSTDKAEAIAHSSNTAAEDKADKAVSANVDDNTKNTAVQAQPDKDEFILGDDEAEMMISFSNTMQQFSNMGKIQAQLSGLMRSAETDEEKIEIQGKINSVSEAISSKTDRSARKLSEINDDERKKKEKRRRMLEEQEARKENMKAALPKSGKSLLEEIKKDGKVLLTRNKS